MADRDWHAARVRTAASADSAAVAGIYNHYIRETIITFEEEPVAACEISRRMDEVFAASLPWLVAERREQVVGYAYASPWRTRRAYRFSAEVTVYVAPDQVGRGIGSMLYAPLLAALRDCGRHAAMGVIALPNDASVALHHRFGFRNVGHLQEVGFKLDRWIDVGYWQVVL